MNVSFGARPFVAIELTPDGPEACAVWYKQDSADDARLLLQALEKIAAKIRRDVAPPLCTVEDES